MNDNRFSCNSGQGFDRDTVCIDTNRVLDSCRDRDCYENVRVYLSGYGTEILNRTGVVRVRSATVLWSNIGIDPIRFNRGFYSITVRFFIRIVCEACCGGGHSQELSGICVLEKRVILYGGENNANIFRSSTVLGDDNFCSLPDPDMVGRNVPTAVVETVEPVVLGSKIMEKACDCNCCCCCQENDIPEPVARTMDAPLNFDDDSASRYLTVSLGIFSVIRILRPTQILVRASEYTVPEKECLPVEDDDPCKVFRSMPFPISEFSTCGCREEHHGGCGCSSGDRPKCGCGKD